MMEAQTVDALLDAGQVAPAYVISGLQGASLASVFIQRLFCETVCGSCGQCTKLAKHTHPDVRWIRTDGKNIKIDQVRELQKLAIYPPLEASFKVFVIEEADRLSREASNSLLKILEAPPPYLVFLLLTQRLGDLLPTVVSRCRVVRGGIKDLDAELHRACWGNPAWCDVFPVEARQSPLPDKTPEALESAFEENDLISLYHATLTLFSTLERWTITEVLQFAANWSRIERPKLEYGLQGLLFLYHKANESPSTSTLEVLRQLSLSYGALRGNANAQLLIESTLLKLRQLMKSSKSL